MNTAVSRAILRRAGVGQLVTSPSADPNASPAMAGYGQLAQQAPIPMALMGLGGLAMLVGIIGAVVSDQYRKEFVYAAAGGLAADLVGSIWFASSASTVMQQVAAQQAQQQQVPIVSPGQPQLA